MADAHLSALARLPLHHLSLGATGVGDPGIAHLLTATDLCRLDLRCPAPPNYTACATPPLTSPPTVIAHQVSPLPTPRLCSGTRVGDASWSALAALPHLQQLDLSACINITFGMQPGLQQLQLQAFTSLRLLGSGVDGRGCRSLAAALPALVELELGGGRVDDRGIKTLCSSLTQARRKEGGGGRGANAGAALCLLTRLAEPPATAPRHRPPPPPPPSLSPPPPPPASSACAVQLESLHLHGCAVTDPGLLSALPRCATLIRLALHGCWMATEAGLAAACAAAVQAGGRLSEVALDGQTLPFFQREVLPANRAAAAPGLRSQAGSSGGVSMATTALCGRGAQRPHTAVGTRSPELAAHDERMQYCATELLQLASMAAAPGAVDELRHRLPEDLLSSHQSQADDDAAAAQKRSP